ncbi:retention module-containing protein [Pseudomonas chlororaphis]|uniref:retention module-containing protein n=1 Tax=Pseudomonas chlororaphis TaxID=587753 RepID=UPI000BE34B2B|nr:retention module-containing protein [Pseudomonas chlororaphis]
MARLIGVVSKVIGQVVAVAADGSRRVLVEGDRLFAGDQLVTGAEGAVAVHLQNGQELTLGRDSSLQLTPQLLANQAPHVQAPEAVTPSEAQLTDVEQLQKAIAAGADPTQTGEATAAGPGATGGSAGALGGGHTFVLLEEVAGRVEPVIGFPTAGFNGIPEFVPERIAAVPPSDDGDIALPPPPNNPVTLGGLSVANGELTLSEANLPQGSASNPAALVQNGTFSVSAPDGLLNLSVGGIAVVSGGVAAGFPQSITTVLGNTLTIIGFDPATGTVSYSYTLVGNEIHSAADGANNLSEHFTVLASDSNGDSVSNSLDINITDDVPQAFNDSNGVASESLLTLSGNVLTNDVQGADRVPSGPITAGTFNGTYGTLVLAADGTYTYTLHTGDPAFLALQGGGSGTDTFAYTLTDADGDSSTANLVLQVHNNDDPVVIRGFNLEGAEVMVYEKHLADGSSPDAGALTQSGTFSISALDGLQNLTVGGLSLVSGGVAAGFPQSISTGLGNTLTITGYDPGTGVVSYSYTLVVNDAHPTGNGNNALGESFTVVATDVDGSTTSGLLDINVVDDVPTAVDDSNGVASESQLTLSGNVLTNDIQGADRVAGGPITAGTFNGTYGTLVLAADGTYTYTLHTGDPAFLALQGGGSGTETFAYTLTDADGDSSTANLVLQVHNNDDPVVIQGLNIEGGEITVYEKNLADGSSPNAGALTQSDSFTLTALDGMQSLTVGGINVVTGGLAAGFPQSVTTALGNTLTITGYNAATGVISYSYTLADNEDHPTANGANSLSEHFNVVATDVDGSTASGSLDVNVVDDLPTAVGDSNGVASESQLTLSGNVLSNDVQGADRVPTGPVTAGTFAGTYGTLVLAADGSYTYILNTADADFKALPGNGSGTETFAYTITDADGDPSTANLVLNIHNNDDGVTLNGLDSNGGELRVYEKNLPDGSSPNVAALTQSGSFTITALDGLQTLTVGGISVVSGGVAAGFPQSITTDLGNTLTITGYNAATGVISYSYTLVDNEDHPTANGANSLSEHFNVVATDVDGSTASGSLDVNVVDDLPTAVNDSNGVASESQLVLSGNVLSNDVQGADRVPTGPVTAGTFAGTYGTLVLAADGSYTYTLNTSDADFKALPGNGSGTETFAYTITDADGDSSTANLVLDIHNDDDCVTLHCLDIPGGELRVYEKHLSDGTSPNAPALTQSGFFIVTAPDGLQTLTVGGINVVTGGVAAGFPQSIATALGNTLTITGYDASTGVVSYSYTLLDNENHPTGLGANSIAEHFTVLASDSDGSSASGVLDVTIVDDLPTANPDVVMADQGTTISGNVLGNDIAGADGPAATGAVVGVRAGSDTSTSAIGGLNTTINGLYGTLTLDTFGNATYHSYPNSVTAPDSEDVFVYTVRDADGDESTTTITIQICGNQLTAVTDQDVTVFEKALDLSKDGQDLAAGTVIGSDPGNTGETSTGTLVGSVTGGSGTITYTLVGSATGTYGQILLNPDGTYRYTLTSAPKTSPTANDGPNVLSESFTYKATDAVGNTTTSTIQIDIVDDVPKAVASERAVTALEVDSNLLLVIDVSGSMVDPSGVPGLSRLDLAKQAISALLDKYDDMGDVKVQIVTFSSSATDKTPIWVDVATAKSIIASLTAGGGTNYDAAVAAAKLAFVTSGQISGAQNVGYFFSDGKPTDGQEIGTADETAWKAFLDANGIKNYAIGLGSGVSNSNLDPLAYDGSTHIDTNAVVVTDLNQLDSVLAGTVQGTPVTGTLLGEGGSFGADGGFIKTLVVDGTTYTYDPNGNGNQGSLSFSGGVNHGTFNTLDNSLSIATNNGGTLVVKLDTGDYTYSSQKITSVVLTETVGFTASDNDGDLASSTLVIKVNPNAAPVAGDDHIITNILSGTIVVPADALLANDSDANGDPLTAAPTSFDTGWLSPGADFTAGSLQTIGFTGGSNQTLTVARASFNANTVAMTAAVVISGFLGSINNGNGNNDEDVISVNLKQGETLNLDHNLTAGRVGMEYAFNGGAYTAIADGGSFTAGADGTYQIHITNLTNPSGGNANGSENYQLTMTVNYAGGQDSTPDYHGTYTASDSHGGSDSAAVSISYQGGHTLTGTAGDDVLLAGSGDNLINAGDGNDVLIAGSGNNTLHGDAGNDLLFGGPGNDLLDGGTGNDTASYAHAGAGVTVDLSLLGAQNTGGAGSDILTAIENLVGSNYNDNLTGDNNANIIAGGLGNDVLNGGGGDDLLIGGPGNNSLTGGSGSDTFQWQQGNSGHDLVTDFTPGIDKLDLSQLLQGENASSASLDDYLQFTVTGSGPSLVTSIDVSAVAGATPSQTIDLAGVNLAAHYGVTPGAGGVIAGGADTATIINGMLNDHSLKVDNV